MIPKANLYLYTASRIKREWVYHNHQFIRKYSLYTVKYLGGKRRIPTLVVGNIRSLVFTVIEQLSVQVKKKNLFAFDIRPGHV
jgi:hypothetical protein